MRNIFVLLITVSLLGMVTCSSDGTSSITSPSALPPDNSSPATENGVCSQGDCQFGAVPYPGAASRWHGEAEPDSIPSLGHPGHLTVNFPKSFYWGVTLKWAKFHHGAKAECTITNNVNSWSYVVPDHCGTGEGTLVVVPPYTPSGVVEYTFTDKENPEQSADQWQVAKVKVTLPTQVTDITATWEPRTGYNMEDPTQM